MGRTGGDFHLPIKGVVQESLAEAREQNVGLKEFGTPKASAALHHLAPVLTMHVQPRLGIPRHPFHFRVGSLGKFQTLKMFFYSLPSRTETLCETELLISFNKSQELLLVFSTNCCMWLLSLFGLWGLGGGQGRQSASHSFDKQHAQKVVWEENEIGREGQMDFCSSSRNPGKVCEWSHSVKASKRGQSQESRREGREAGVLVIQNYRQKRGTGDVERILERRDLHSLSSCHFDKFCHLSYNS